MLAQSAARAGLDAIALDIFGDRDTREHALAWFDIGGEGLAIDRTRLFDALERAARMPRLLGFIVTSGLEPLMGELYRHPRLPRLIGNDAEATALGARSAAVLRAAGRAGDRASGGVLCAPRECARVARQARGRLRRRACRSGFVERERGGYLLSSARASGRSMSALFVGARREATVIGFAEQLTVTAGTLPFVHAGSLGPVDLPRETAAAIA